MAQTGTMTGNRVTFKIKGKIIGTARNVRIQDDFGLQDVDGLGSPIVLEHVVGKISHSISGEKYFIGADTLIALGFVPTEDDWLTAPELEVEVIDKVSGKTVELYTGCKFATHSRNYQAHMIVGEDFTIKSISKKVT